jgi:hypothetical protein
MKKQSYRILVAAALAMVGWSCNQSDPTVKGDYVQGVFVMNEGNFFDNNGGVSYFKRESTTADADVFNLVNNVPLQGGVRGYAVAGDKGVILVDNSKAGLDRVQIVDANSFTTIGSMGTPDIENPRKVVVSGNTKAYVSCWGPTGAFPNFFTNAGYVAVIDLLTNKVVKKIPTTKGAEAIVLAGGKLFVGTIDYSGSNVLTVISTATDEVVRSVNYAASPIPVGMDANGKLWVNAGSDMIRVDPDSYQSESTIKIGTNAAATVGNFAFSNDKKTIYFGLSTDYGVSGATYKISINDTQINLSTPFLNRYFSGLAVDPSQGLIYGGVNPSYAQSGYAVRYRADGSLVDSVKVGVAPIGFTFR